MFYYLIIYFILTALLLFFNSKQAKVFSIVGIILLAGIWRLNSWLHPYSLCIDEAEWLSLAGRLTECKIPYKCYNGSTSGFLSIGFVSILNLLGLELSYINLRVFGFLTCIIPTLLFTYAGLKRWYGEKVSTLVFPWLGMIMIFGFYDREFLSYNTEYPLMLLYSIIYYLFSRWKQNKFEQTTIPIIIGFILGVLPYIKLQAVPFVFAFFTAICFFFVTKRMWSKSLYFGFALILPSVIIVLYFVCENVLHDFYKMYIEANAYYVKHRITQYKYSENEFIHRLRAFKGMHINTYLPVYLGIIPIIMLNVRKVFGKDFFINIFYNITFWVFCWVCYSTYTTGNGFGHYNILLIIPLIYLIGNFYSYIINYYYIYLKWLTILGFLLAGTMYLFRLQLYFSPHEDSYTNIEKYIFNKTATKEPVLLLGYTYALETQIRTKRKLPVRNATTHFITIKDTSLRRYFQDGFIEDMRLNPPTIVIDTEEVLYNPDLNRVRNFIFSNYEKDTIIDNHQIFRKKQFKKTIRN